MEELEKIAARLAELVAEFQIEHDKHVAGNASAGGRARKCIGEIKNLCTPYRKISIELDKFRKAEKKK